MDDEPSASGVAFVLIVLAFLYFIGIPFAVEITTVHDKSIVICGIAGNIVEDQQGGLWKLTHVDKYTLMRLQPGDRLAIRWVGPLCRHDPTGVTVENITWMGV